MDQSPLDIVLCGSDFAVWLTALALRRQLPADQAITVIETAAESSEAHLYGYVLPPEIYPFHLKLGISEPDFLLNSTASFCWGTEFQNWGTEKQSWVQAFHQPLPVWDGVAFPKIIAASPQIRLQDCLISVAAARAGRFAHPPEDPDNPLSRAEYGYAFDPKNLSEFYCQKACAAGVDHIRSTIKQIACEEDRITAITLQDGTRVSGDVFIDMTGSSALLRQDTALSEGVPFSYSVIYQTSTDLGPAHRTVEGQTDGWSSSVRVRGQAIHLHIGLDADTSKNENILSFETGHRDTPWIGNCVALGLTAHQILPLTLTPIKLLLKDLQRLLNLIPVSDQMNIEAREFNRSCAEDRLHASLFDDAHYVGVHHPKTDFWEQMTPDQTHPKLDRKLKNFEARAYHVAYDHEAFDAVDWAILHEGLGRMPATADALTRALDLPKQERRLKQMRGTIAAIVRKMPPHSLYMSKFLDYLERKQGLNG